MNEVMLWPGLLGALIVPWVCGALWCACLLGNTGRHNLPMLLGHGFFVGYFINTVVIRVWDACGLRLAFMPLLAIMLVLCVIGWIVLVRYAGYNTVQQPRQKLSVVARVFVGVLLSLIVWRYATLFQELLLRPLYGWDSWMNWMPKAVVWYHQMSLVEFVSPQTWLDAGTASTYTLGNAQAWDYPISVPIIQLWAMLGAGTWDHPALLLPWLLVPPCLALIFYGHLRLAGAAVPLSLGACYVLLNMPYINVHSVLAGYADLWLGAAFAAAICALYELRRSPDCRYAILCLILAAFCAQLKVPGMFLALIIVIFIARTYLNMALWQELSLAATLVLAFLVLLTVGVSFNFPHLGQVILSWEEMRVGRAGVFKLQYHSVESAFFESYFRMINWNLLVYFTLAITAISAFAGAWKRRPGSELLAVFGGFIFVTAVFTLSGYYSQALNFVALNRALLHIIPALVFVLFLRTAMYFNAGIFGPGKPGF